LDAQEAVDFGLVDKIMEKREAPGKEEETK
jgi:ATP-dependent Clp protease protease subunit